MVFSEFCASAATFAVALGLGGGYALADKVKHPTAVFAGLDKITGRIIAFEVATDETVQFGSLQITPRACFTRPQTEAPQTDGFVEVDEIAAGGQTKRIFSGWMFAASPGLHGVEHPVYDVWLTDCKGGTQVIPSPPDTTAELEPAAPAKAPDAVKPPPPPKPGTVPRPRHAEPAVEPLPGSPGAPALPSAQTRGPIEVGPPPGGAGGGVAGAAPAPRQSAGPLPPADIPNVPRRQPTQRFFPTAPVGLPDPAGPQ